MSGQLFYLFSAVLLGLVIGALIMYFASGSNKDSEKTIAKLEKKLESYQNDVVDHFEETADLVDDLTQSYKKVFDHLGKSARKLMTEEQIQRQLEMRKGNKVTLEYLTEPSQDSGPVNDDNEVNTDVGLAEAIPEGSSVIINESNENEDSPTDLEDSSVGELDVDSKKDKGEINELNHHNDEVEIENIEADRAGDTDTTNEAEVDLEKEVEIREKNIYN